MKPIKLLFEKPKQTSWEYDKGADVLRNCFAISGTQKISLKFFRVLYISFGKPQKAISLDLGSGIVARYLETHRNSSGISGAQKSSKKISRESNELVGFTIVGLKHVLMPAK